MSSEDQVRRLLAKGFNLDPGEMLAETKFIEDLRFDSLDFVEAVMLIEDEMQITIPDEQLEGVDTFGDLVALIDKIQANPEGKRP